MRSLAAPAVAILLVSLFGCGGADTEAPASAETPSAQRTIFQFETDGFWLNLHHFLYVLGRAEAGEGDAARRAVRGAPAEQEQGLEALDAEQQAAWQSAVAKYARGPSRLDTVFDQELYEVTGALRSAGETLDSVALPDSWREALEGAADAYRSQWWPDHRQANRRFVEQLTPLVDEFGEAILEKMEAAYGDTWPEDGYPVQVSAYSNWAGAYSTHGELLVVASLDAGLRGAMALEIVFHEAAHQWDAPFAEAMNEASTAGSPRFRSRMSHAILFFTVGEISRQILPDHEPYAFRFRLWERSMSVFLEPLQTEWRPYLEGDQLGDDGARRDALERLIQAVMSSVNQDAA